MKWSAWWHGDQPGSTHSAQFKSYFWVLWKKSEKLDLGWTLETMTKITSKTIIWCIFACFHQLGFTGVDALATALKDSTAANSSSPYKTGRVAESPHPQASLLEMLIPGAPAYCMRAHRAIQAGFLGWKLCGEKEREEFVPEACSPPHLSALKPWCFCASLQPDVFEESHIE